MFATHAPARRGTSPIIWPSPVQNYLFGHTPAVVVYDCSGR
ncbi:hypothetical protein [Rhizohabitans arisaemae]|nr:hypothetical protein [Rhizohabitans arisaemae]